MNQLTGRMTSGVVAAKIVGDPRTCDAPSQECSLRSLREASAARRGDESYT
jgi:hypothetical protein